MNVSCYRHSFILGKRIVWAEAARTPPTASLQELTGT